jgi:DNA-binding Lrp family transcriptional regulator
MTGDFDYLLRVVVADASDYERVHRSRLTRLPGVSRVQSSFALRVVQHAVALPLGVESETG